MVLAREQIVEQHVRFGFRALQQLIRSPGAANHTSGIVTVPFRKQRPRKREAALGAGRVIACEAANGGGVAAFLPQPRLRPLAHESHTRPTRTISNERCVSAEVRVSVRMAQDEPFNEFPSRRIGDRPLYGGSLGCLCLAREIDRILYRRKISRERRSVRSRGQRRDGSRRLALLGSHMLCTSSFLVRRIAVVPSSARVMRLSGVRRLVVGPCRGGSRTHGA